MSEVETVLMLVRQDTIIEIIALLALVGLLAIMLSANYEPKWNKKKPRVFRERF